MEHGALEDIIEAILSQGKSLNFQASQARANC